jgi:hypothetical protein
MMFRVHDQVRIHDEEDYSTALRFVIANSRKSIKEMGKQRAATAHPSG